MEAFAKFSRPLFRGTAAQKQGKAAIEDLWGFQRPFSGYTRAYGLGHCAKLCVIKYSIKTCELERVLIKTLIFHERSYLLSCPLSPEQTEFPRFALSFKPAYHAELFNILTGMRHNDNVDLRLNRKIKKRPPSGLLIWRGQPLATSIIDE
jgi:hypothetical protein